MKTSGQKGDSPVVIGVIPARGGSKGIPRKNVTKVAGKPLLAWSIEAAKEAKRLDRFVVSTEDPEIKRVAAKWGAEIVNRPPDLATDTSGSWDVVRHVLRTIPADVVVLLQPTSPIRSPGLVDRCLKRYFDEGADTLATGFMCKFKEFGSGEHRRQDVDGFFYDDGNIYIVDAAMLLSGRSVGSRIVRYFVTPEESVDIDDEFDLWLARKILKSRRISSSISH